MNFSEIRTLASSLGFPDPDTAAAIAMAESGGNPCANGDPHNVADCNNQFDSTSFGLWQIHVSAHPEYDPVQLKDPRYNAIAAYTISRSGTKWTDWSTYTTSDPNLSYLRFMPPLARAMPTLKLIAGLTAIGIIVAEVVKHGGIVETWHAAGRTVRRYV